VFYANTRLLMCELLSAELLTSSPYKQEIEWQQRSLEEYSNINGKFNLATIPINIIVIVGQVRVTSVF